MKIWKNKLIYIKLGLISPVLEIIVNTIYILSFILIFYYFCSNGKYYNDNQISKFTESYINYENFKNINSPSDLKTYIKDLTSKLFNSNPSTEKIPIFMPLNPIRITRFINNYCKEENYLTTCNNNFQCVINSMSNSFKDKCGEKYSNANNADEDNNNANSKKLFLESLVNNFKGYYSNYDLLHGGRSVEITNHNINNKIDEIDDFITNKNVKFISIEINLKSPINNNYIDIILGLEMYEYFHDIKKILSINIFNTYSRPKENYFLYILVYIYMVTIIINIIKLVYEIMVKPVFSIHIFVLLNEACNTLLFIFLILFINVDKNLDINLNLAKFNSHLVETTMIYDLKIIMIIVFLGIPVRVLSVVSWWKWFSAPFIKVANIFFRMFPSVIISFFVALIFLVVFTITNYLMFQDIFTQYQTFYDSFLNVFNFRILSSLYIEENNSKIFHNMTQSKYTFILLLFEYVFFLLSFCIIISSFIHLYKKANSIEEPKQESEYLNKMENLIEKLKENVEDKNVDLIGIKKQILYLKLTPKNLALNNTTKIELTIFKNSQQIISFLKYIFALKPELQFKNLLSLLNIVIEVNHYDNFNWNFDLKQIIYLIKWLTFIGCKIPLIIYCEPNFEKNYHLKLCRDYTLIKFVNDKNELENIMNKKDFGNFIIDNKFILTIKSKKKNKLKN